MLLVKIYRLFNQLKTSMVRGKKMVLTASNLLSRGKAISAVEEDLDIDEMLPKYVIQNQGDVTKNLSGMEMHTKGQRMVKLISEANEKEKELEEKRSKLSEQLFGKAESYLDIPKETKKGEEPVALKATGEMSTKTKWFIVLGLSIVALSWGIWTAIGVFILGSIIIGILK